MSNGTRFVEKRSNPRVPIKIPLKFRLLDGAKDPATISGMRKTEISSQAVDASLGGMYIILEQKLDIGNIMSLHFTLPEIPGELSAFAEVVWGNESGVGVHFLALKPEDMQSLDWTLSRPIAV